MYFAFFHASCLQVSLQSLQSPSSQIAAPAAEKLPDGEAAARVATVTVRSETVEKLPVAEAPVAVAVAVPTSRGDPARDCRWTRREGMDLG